STWPIPSTSRAMPTSVPAPRCDPMWTLTKAAPKLGAVSSSDVSIATDRSKVAASGPGRFTRYDAWIDTGRMSNASVRSRNEASCGDRARRRRQAVGLSAKTCMALAPMARARSTALTIPGASGRCAPILRPSGSIQRSAPPAVVLVVPGHVLAAHDRLDHPKVAVLPCVEDRHPLGLGVDEDVELMPELLHRGDGVLLEHRLDRETLGLDDASLATRIGGPIRDVTEDPLLLLRSVPEPWLLLVVDRLAFDLVDDIIEGRLVAATDRVTPERATVDDERDLGDVGIRGAAMHLVGELDDRVGAVVEEPIEALELALGIA